jgi:TonB-linked SusC/RagA family outer membrane protein
MNNMIRYNNSTATKRAVVALTLFLGCGMVVFAQQATRRDSIKVVYDLTGKRVATDETASVSSISGKAVSGNTVMSFGNALYGRIPGLMVTQTSGEPGDDYPVLHIRGLHTNTGSNTPLVLVDGFPRDFNTLNPDEVESVSVLKDAAATALYGMDGANGVVLVTTKRGHIGKTRVMFGAEFGLRTPIRLPKFYGSYDYANFYNQAEANDGKTSFTYSQDQLNGYKNHLDSQLYSDVDWLGETIRKATPTQTYTTSISGGSEYVNYYVNLGYMNSQGLYKETKNKSYDANNKLDRFNFRSNIDISITSHFKASVDLAGRLENLNSPYNSSSSIWDNLYTFHPNATPIYVAQGVWGGTNTYRNNPLAYINDCGYRHTHRRLLQADVRLTYDLSKLVDGLEIGAAAAFNNYYTVDNGYSKTYAVQDVLAYTPATKSYVLGPTYGQTTALSAYGPSNEGEYYTDSYEFWTHYGHQFGNHGISAKLLFHVDNAEQYYNDSDLGNSPDRRVFGSGVISYNYLHKYMVDVAASYGGGENFMRGKRFGWFPSIAGAWMISSEKFMKDVKFIDMLKLRASTGLVGNQNVGGITFGYRNIYSYVSGGWGAGTNNASYAGGYAEGTLANEELTWEKAWKTDVAVEARFLHDFDFMFDYYYEYRYDILNSADAMVPSFMGVSAGYTNYGRVANYGFETSLAYKHQFGEWKVNAGISADRMYTKILRLSESKRLYDYLYKVGNPLGSIYGLVVEGYYSADDVANRKVTQSFGTVIPGSLKYKDVNNDGIVNSDDYVCIGKTNPDWELGFDLGLNYKGVYANAHFQALLGRDVDLRSSAPYITSPLYYDRNISTFIKQPWTAEAAADPALASTIDFPSLSIENSANNFQTSTYFLRNGDFLRLRSLEVGYEFPKNLVGKIGLQAATVYFRGMNLLTWDHIKDFDPEVLEGYPVMESYNVGINFTF